MDFVPLTLVQQRHGAVLMGAVGSGAWAVASAGVDHEVPLLPAVFLKRAAQFFVSPDELQDLPCGAHLTLGALPARPPTFITVSYFPNLTTFSLKDVHTVNEQILSTKEEIKFKLSLLCFCTKIKG